VRGTEGPTGTKLGGRARSVVAGVDFAHPAAMKRLHHALSIGSLFVALATVGASAAGPPIRIYLFTTALPSGIPAEIGDRREATLRDVRDALTKKKEIVIADSPDAADVTVELVGTRVVHREDARIEAVDLDITAAGVHHTVRGTASRALDRWKSAANDAVASALQWIIGHSDLRGRL
jgi:hypothetical protein